jgi:hypothetical protein
MKTMMRWVAGFALAMVVAAPVWAAPKAAKVTTPLLAHDASSDVSIDIRVTAPLPGTGLPGGFSLQWMTAADYSTTRCTVDPNTLVSICATGWYASDDLRLCKASFSGKANGYNYNIPAGGSVVVSVGDFLLDEGASTTCNERLACGTDYVFRGFGHATNSLQRSDFTPNYTFSTQACATNCPIRSTTYPFLGACTNTQGFWGSHGPDPSGNNENQFAMDGVTFPATMMLGLNAYTDVELAAIFDAPVSGNGLIALAHQLIAAKLNIMHGATAPQETLDAIALADALIGSKVVPPVGSGFVKPGETSGLTDLLRDFNEGAVGPGHCLGSEEYQRCIAGGA